MEGHNTQFSLDPAPPVSWKTWVMVRLHGADLIHQDAGIGEHCGWSQRSTLLALPAHKKFLGTEPVGQLICKQRGKLWWSLLPSLGVRRRTDHQRKERG